MLIRFRPTTWPIWVWPMFLSPKQQCHHYIRRVWLGTDNNFSFRVKYDYSYKTETVVGQMDFIVFARKYTWQMHFARFLSVSDQITIPTILLLKWQTAVKISKILPKEGYSVHIPIAAIVNILFKFTNSKNKTVIKSYNSIYLHKIYPFLRIHP